MPRPVALRRSDGTPVAIRIALVLACPVIAAVTVVATFLGKELIVAAAWLALGMVALLFVKPVVGIAVMTGVYLLDAYPTLLQALGVLTVNNLLGLCLAVLLAAHLIETRDLSFVKTPQVLILIAIGVVFWVGSVHADTLFPLLQESRGRGKIIDRTDIMAHDFVTRLAFLVFMLVFMRTRNDIRAVYFTFVLMLFTAVPSALTNWVQGELNRGYRVIASFTLGANPNKLAMLCLMQVACWWFWGRWGEGTLRRLTAAAAIGASFLVLLVTGSRSGLLGAGVLLVLLGTGPRGQRVTVPQMAALAIVGALAVATVVPEETWTRMTTITPEAGEVGATSNLKREDTLVTGWAMVRDHPWLGVGLGNFREVARQVYNNPYFRPPHNSYLWAWAEGGVFVLLGYVLLFAVTWRDTRVITRLAHRDVVVARLVAPLRVVFLLYCFFCLFADLWLTPLTYVLMGLIMTARRYLESLPAPALTTVVTPRRLAAVAA
jgi:O-antigen ligase